jgi:hypothetical protein
MLWHLQIVFGETVAGYCENHMEHTSQETLHHRYKAQPVNAV